MAVIATYTYDPDSIEARKQHLAEHLAFIEGLEGGGKLLAVGRVEAAEVDIVFLLDFATTDEARAALSGDPYRAHGYITAVSAHEWAPKRGRLAPL